ncbi:SirA family protein [Clostridium botulinum]|uniref:sulfurtransferase TusA family protein n=1 Tax=Clostridium botulinum TaxID=1491 RepID=UPI0013F05672|nr:sulfurtransferase TusA family protein [Clostridium botulinum]MBY6998155.1 sulfurtransferase TusA family protein [Clostridium botulinum]MBY7012585.1 sulfurtransferase TusA family protein [Clostridium botulinum]MCR1156112.1 sulfurtransferase TusA family protein [Clostridium botulinum]MCS6167901.1 SirA family protein [Clostridium botulinum]NEZ74812.1 SirA family protein [Clostridium botulinum]
MLVLVQIDARGASCPQPVLMTKKALDNNKDGIDVIVDNMTARGNVERFMKNSGYKVTIKEKEDDFIVSARK